MQGELFIFSFLLPVQKCAQPRHPVSETISICGIAFVAAFIFTRHPFGKAFLAILMFSAADPDIRPVITKSAGFLRVMETGFQNNMDLLPAFFTSDGTGQFDAPFSVPCHEISGGDVDRLIISPSETVYPAVLQISSNDTYYFNVFRLSGYVRQQAAYSSDYHSDTCSCSRRVPQRLYYIDICN